jgi:hypothetical protein
MPNFYFMAGRRIVRKKKVIAKLKEMRVVNQEFRIDQN